MVRTVVCGAADEGSIPSGHPTTREECTLPAAAPSRHLVDVLTIRFGPLWGIKEMPTEVAEK
jgi:hypothetical protein